jgi:hypothetical protein
MVILGTFAPTVVYSLINDSSHNSTLISATTPPTTVDKFGVKKMYPTKMEGEWYINLDSPTSDGIFVLL